MYINLTKDEWADAYHAIITDAGGQVGDALSDVIRDLLVLGLIVEEIHLTRSTMLALARSLPLGSLSVTAFQGVPVLVNDIQDHLVCSHAFTNDRRCVCYVRFQPQRQQREGENIEQST